MMMMNIHGRSISLFNESVKVCFSSNSNQLAVILNNSIFYHLFKYHASEISIIRFEYREWVVSDDLDVAYSQAVKILDDVIRKRFYQNKIVYTVSTDSGVGGISHVSNVKTPQLIEKLKNNKNIHLSPMSFLFDTTIFDLYKDMIESPKIIEMGEFVLFVDKVEINSYKVRISPCSDFDVTFIEFLDTYDNTGISRSIIDV